jgi:pimeloyl-ACP methyl ester carboxylesterase
MEEENQMKVKISYETLWKFIIRPPRDKYPLSYLGHTYFTYKDKNYIRKDFDLISTQGYKMKCSLIEPDPSSRPSKEMPLVVYLHGNASSRLEGLRTLTILLPHNINLFIVDFPGCGHSEGEYISLGYYESKDLKIIIDFLENFPGVGKIGLWGRSMGAATALIYAHKDNRIKALCMDSPFANFCRLAKELTTSYISIPEFLINGALSIIRGTILSKNGMDIYKLNPIEEAPKAFQPAIFIHAINDQLINLQHSIDIFNIYGGEKSLKCSEIGGHNSKRPKRISIEVGKFFAQHLANDKNEFEFSNNIKNSIILGDNDDEEIYTMGEYHKNEKFEKIQNNNINSDAKDINKSFYDLKIGEISQEEYIFQKEEEEKKNLDEIKNVLINIKQNNNIKKDDNK